MTNFEGGGGGREEVTDEGNENVLKLQNVGGVMKFKLRIQNGETGISSHTIIRRLWWSG